MTKKVASYYDAVEKQRRVRVFMDGIDWQHHLGSDSKGTETFPSLAATKREKSCLAKGGRCGVVEVEVRLIGWVEEQDLHAEMEEKRNAAPQEAGNDTGTKADRLEPPAVAAPDGESA